jgi:hypothetical protein
MPMARVAQLHACASRSVAPPLLPSACRPPPHSQVEMKSILDSVRTDMGVLKWLKTEQPNNPTFIMATCGSKGSEVNICQMMCCVRRVPPSRGFLVFCNHNILP